MGKCGMVGYEAYMTTKQGGERLTQQLSHPTYSEATVKADDLALHEDGLHRLWRLRIHLLRG